MFNGQFVKLFTIFTAMYKRNKKVIKLHETT